MAVDNTIRYTGFVKDINYNQDNSFVGVLEQTNTTQDSQDSKTTQIYFLKLNVTDKELSDVCKFYADNEQGTAGGDNYFHTNNDVKLIVSGELMYIGNPNLKQKLDKVGKLIDNGNIELKTKEKIEELFNMMQNDLKAPCINVDTMKYMRLNK